MCRMCRMQVASWSGQLSRENAPVVVHLLAKWSCKLDKTAAANLDASFCKQKLQLTQQVSPAAPNQSS